MAHEDELSEWKHSRVGIMSFCIYCRLLPPRAISIFSTFRTIKPLLFLTLCDLDAIICAISISAIFILRALVLCTLKPRPADDYQKGKLHSIIITGPHLAPASTDHRQS